MLTDYRLRLARLDDGRFLYAACYPHLSLPIFLEQFERACSWQQRGRGLCLVAELSSPAADESPLVGCGQLLRYPHSAEIADLVVAPARRNRGIGSSLILQLLATAVSWRLPAVEISVARDNEGARRLYQRLGFDLDRELKLPGHAEPAVVLRLELADH